MTSVRQAKRQHNVQKWTQIIMEQRASGLSGLAYCRRAGINSGTARATRIHITGKGSLRFIEVHKAVLSTSAVTTASFGDLLWDNTYHGNHLAPQIPQGIQRHPEHLDNILPWNETIQQNCK